MRKIVASVGLLWTAFMWVPSVALGETIAFIELVKTVGTDPGVCASTDPITVTAGTEVTYCYTMTNSTGITLSRHDLFDDHLGNILFGDTFDVAPGGSTSITRTATINATTVNTATWTASQSIIITETAHTDDAGAGQVIVPAFVSSDDCVVNVELVATEPDAGPDGCSDGVDNDGDGQIDCGDPDCVNTVPCVAPAPALGPTGLVVMGLILLSIGESSLVLRRKS